MDGWSKEIKSLEDGRWVGDERRRLRQHHLPALCNNDHDSLITESSAIWYDDHLPSPDWPILHSRCATISRPDVENGSSYTASTT